jgi:hypothetical protein
MQYSSFDNSPKILDMEKYNGRVNIAVAENPETVFSMFERTAIKTSPPTTATRWGTAREHGVVPTVFSSENIQIIQNGIKAGCTMKQPRVHSA